MDTASITALALLTLGVLLVIAELLIGSDGSFLIIAGVCLAVGAVTAVKSWWLPGDIAWWAYPLLVVIVVPGLVWGGIVLFPRTALGRQIMAAPEDDQLAPVVDDAANRLKWIGMTGRTVSVMNPGGIIILNGERLHAETAGFMLEAGEEVEVIDVKGTRLVVCPVNAGNE